MGLSFLFLQPWIVKLFADCDTGTGPDEFRQIRVERVMRESGNFHVFAADVPFSGGNGEDFARPLCILAVCFVEVTEPEQQYCVGVLPLHFVIP